MHTCLLHARNNTPPASDPNITHDVFIPDSEVLLELHEKKRSVNT